MALLPALSRRKPGLQNEWLIPNAHCSMSSPTLGAWEALLLYVAE
jgi:hypothetical protein